MFQSLRICHDDDYDDGKLESHPVLLTYHHFLLLTSIWSTSPAIVINVDVDIPEQNHETKVVPFIGVEHEGKLHDGFEILMECDVHDFLSKLYYKAELVSNNRVLIMMPSASHTYLHGFEPFFEKMNEKNPETYSQPVHVGHNVARNAIIDGGKDCKTKKLLLCFLAHIVLSRNHYLKTKAELQDNMIPLKTKFEWYGMKLVRIHDVVFWRVAIHNDNPKVVTRAVDNELKEAAKLAALFVSMSLP